MYLFDLPTPGLGHVKVTLLVLNQNRKNMRF